MNFLSSAQAAQWILNLVFNSIVIVGIGWVLAKIFGRKAAPLRSGLILMILIILMLMPILSLHPALPNLYPFQITLPLSISSSVEMTGDGYIPEIEGVTAETLTPYTKKTKFLPSISGLSIIRIINVFGIIWGLGFMVCLFRFIYGTKSLNSFRNGIVEINDAKVTRVLKSLENTFGKRLRSTIFISDALNTPIVMGIFRPIVVIPRSFYIQWNENTVKSILMHELSHIYHKDNLTGIIQRLATSLNWWNPFVYNLSADFSRAREEISDNHVLLENNSRDYAECLICLAENKSLISRLAVFTPLTSPYIPLNDRVKYILSKERKMETHMKKSSILLIFVLSGFFLIFAAGNILTFATTPDSVPTSDPIQEKSTLDQKDIPPRLIKKVEPIYPKEALNAHIEGTVIVEATTDSQGRVRQVNVLKSVPLLDKAAVDAVRQWVYEPMVINGKPRGIIFAIECKFQLGEKAEVDVKIIYDPDSEYPPPPPKTKGDKEKETTIDLAKKAVIGGVIGGVVSGTTAGEGESPVRAVGDIMPPKLIKRVLPIYPKVAKQARIEGVVIVEATTGIYGRVQNVKVLRSIPLLDQAAIDSVFQWIYEPVVLGGKPRSMVFTVTVVFKLDKETETQDPVRAVGDIKPPRLIKRVEPIYPKVAKESRIEATVILEVTTGIYGRVQNVKVLRAIPILDQAAIDAVYQWVYEPFVLNGKPRSVIFTVTVIFKLK